MRFSVIFIGALATFTGQALACEKNGVPGPYKEGAACAAVCEGSIGCSLNRCDVVSPRRKRYLRREAV